MFFKIETCILDNIEYLLREASLPFYSHPKQYIIRDQKRKPWFCPNSRRIIGLEEVLTQGLVTTCLLLLLLARPDVVPPGGDVLTELPQHGPSGPGEALHHALPTSYRLVLLNNMVRRDWL